MTLSTGTRLGPYEILSPLGAGGMGEVYRARDTRLERTVAVKVLSSHAMVSQEARQRFEREARTISQLSHPHICTHHDVGREGETEYLVMEYLEGDTLEDRLAKGPLPLAQTLRYGVAIAEALDAAHRRGISHRDLKPGNVMLTTSGVKLLDFGLAKTLGPAVPADSLTSAPTTARNVTREGTILGTVPGCLLALRPSVVKLIGAVLESGRLWVGDPRSESRRRLVKIGTERGFNLASRSNSPGRLNGQKLEPKPVRRKARRAASRANLEPVVVA